MTGDDPALLQIIHPAFGNRVTFQAAHWPNRPYTQYLPLSIPSCCPLGDEAAQQFVVTLICTLLPVEFGIVSFQTFFSPETSLPYFSANPLNALSYSRLKRSCSGFVASSRSSCVSLISSRFSAWSFSALSSQILGLYLGLLAVSIFLSCA